MSHPFKFSCAVSEDYSRCALLALQKSLPERKASINLGALPLIRRFVGAEGGDDCSDARVEGCPRYSTELVLIPRVQVD